MYYPELASGFPYTGTIRTLLTHYALPRAFRLQPNFIGYNSAFADSQACDPVWIDEQDGLVPFDFNSVARS